MSRADNTGSGLILASSPTAKKKYGISNVSRPRDLPQPFPKTLHVVPPRMNLYIKRNMQVNNIFRRYVADEDLLIYSIDESILKVTRSLNLFTTEGRGPERLVGICIDKGYKFPLNQCFKAYLFFIFNSLKCLGIDNKSNLYSPRKVICSQLIGDTCFIYLVTSGSILTR